MNGVDYRSPYLSRSLVAYIGNKRALLPFLGAAFGRCLEDLDIPSGFAPRLLDPFAGSGGVSRLGRAMGFRVFSNDSECYAATIARCRLLLDPDSLEEAFAAEGGSVSAFAAVDAFARGETAEDAAAHLAEGRGRRAWRDAFAAAETAEPYIARHYAPVSTEKADWRKERLFYTAENARWLDRAREAVERRYPESEGTSAAKDAFVDALVYEAATRTNTSGVFKACHRGFGGHGGDALERIKAPMRLQPPDLIAGPPAEVGCMDAADFCALRPAELAYLDPPYNQHQYGSNYHLLTTVARWDKPPVSEERAADGFLLDRSGIRGDWTATRSDFCRRGRALLAFSRLLDSIDARFILLSYNDGGIAPLDELAELLARHGELRIESRPYVAYRGGKQSASRTERTSELLFVVDRRRSGGRALGSSARERLARLALLGKVDALLRGRFHPDRARSAFASWPGGMPFLVASDGRVDLGPLDPASLDGDLEDFVSRLQACACASAAEAFDLVMDAIGSGAKGRPSRLFRDALAYLRKLAFKKYGADYGPRSARLRAALAAARTEGREAAARASRLAALDALDAQAARRGVIAPRPGAEVRR